jgi:hypothetical protein
MVTSHDFRFCGIWAFGEFDDNGVWVPLNVSGKTFGTTGFLIEGGAAFTNGTDSSGNSQNFTKGGTITDVDDTLTDKASSDIGNYPTWSPIDKDSNVTVSSGNTVAEQDSTGAFKSVLATQVVPSTGSWVWEIKQTVSSFVGDGYATTGVASTDVARSIGRSGSGSITFDYQSSTSKIRKFGGGATESDYATSVSLTNTNFTFQFAIDSDAEELKLFVGNSQLGSTLDISSLTKPYKIISQIYSGGTVDHTLVTNSADFVNNVPSGYKTINTANLPAPTVTDPSKYFQTVIYTGDTNNNRNITGFQDAAGNNVTPDFIWLKGRSNATNHYMQDVARGFGASKDIQSQDNEEQGSLGTSNGYIGGVVAGGFTAVDGSANDAYVNENGRTYVAWMWKAGGSASSNSNGSITSSVSVADHGGFSIMTYTGNGSAGATIGHGLGRAANFQIFKRYDAHQDWHVGTNATGSIIGAELNNNTGSVTAAVTAFNATTTAVAASGVTNDSSAEYVSYAFARTPGAIGVGSYTANGSTDGPTVVIDDGASGFKPAFLLIKNVSRDARYWVMLDNVRNTFNPVQNALIASEVLAEATGYLVDFLAAGFKIRAGDSTQLNTGTDTHVYLAFAENPFGGDGVAQAKAR